MNLFKGYPGLFRSWNSSKQRAWGSVTKRMVPNVSDPEGTAGMFPCDMTTLTWSHGISVGIPSWSKGNGAYNLQVSVQPADASLCGQGKLFIGSRNRSTNLKHESFFMRLFQRDWATQLCGSPAWTLEMIMSYCNVKNLNTPLKRTTAAKTQGRSSPF